MKTYTINQPIWHFNCSNWEQTKKNLLEQISSHGIYQMVNDSNKIYNTDYHVKDTYIDSTYKDLAVNTIKPHLEQLAQQYKLHIQVENLWYQQYKQYDYHDFHNHGQCNFSSVLYLELPENTQTNFYADYERQIEYKLDIQEGDYIIFPSSVIHESKPIEKDVTKTVIAINLNIQVK